MKKYILKVLLLASVCLIWIPISLFFIAPQYTHSYNASFIDKINRLENIHSPKIVLAGNSNLAFGIQSDLIEEELGMPVVNLGLHGGLGNAFHERMPLFNLTKGDIIVLSHLTYDDDDKILDPELALLTVENYFHFWKIFRAKDYPGIILSLPKYAFKCIARYLGKDNDDSPTPTCYAREAFNKYGDNIFPRNVEAGESEPCLLHSGVNSVCMKRINKLYKFCKSKGVSLVIAGVPILSGMEGFDLDEYVQFQQKIEEQAECPLVSDFTNYIFDKKYFYASNLHLTNEGAKLRTEQLIKDLKKYIESKEK